MSTFHTHRFELILPQVKNNHIPATNRRFWPQAKKNFDTSHKFQCDESDAINYAFERS